MINTTNTIVPPIYSNREILIGDISDTFKSVNGFRPISIYDYDNMTESEMESVLKSLRDELHEQMKEEDRRDTEFMSEWNKELQIYLNMGMSRSKGVREMLRCRNLRVPNRNSRMDFESLVFDLNFPWEYKEELRDDLYGR